LWAFLIVYRLAEPISFIYSLRFVVYGSLHLPDNSSFHSPFMVCCACYFYRIISFSIV